jgi:hypothetical protein
MLFIFHFLSFKIQCNYCGFHWQALEGQFSVNCKVFPATRNWSLLLAWLYLESLCGFVLTFIGRVLHCCNSECAQSSWPSLNLFMTNTAIPKLKSSQQSCVTSEFKIPYSHIAEGNSFFCCLLCTFIWVLNVFSVKYAIEMSSWENPTCLSN